MTDKERIAFLTKELHFHNHAYYVLDTPEISDFEFDNLLNGGLIEGLQDSEMAGDLFDSEDNTKFNDKNFFQSSTKINRNSAFWLRFFRF